MERFDKGNLMGVIFCAALMSAVDGNVDKEEWEVIKKFIQAHWVDEFGDFKDAQIKIAANVKVLIRNRAAMNRKLNELVAILRKKLSRKQKDIMLRLVREVMLADLEVSPKEEKLLAQLQKVLDTAS
jgi:tellurite resistance protein